MTQKREPWVCACGLMRIWLSFKPPLLSPCCYMPYRMAALEPSRPAPGIQALHTCLHTLTPWLPS